MSAIDPSTSLLIPGSDGARIRRVAIRNYKSIGRCEVELGPLTLLVGRNGAGKSNVLDALRFVTDGLQTSLDHAVKARGGIEAVRRRSTGHPRNFALNLDLILPGARNATYGFEIAARSRGGFLVRREQLRVRDLSGTTLGMYEVAEGRVEHAQPAAVPPASGDRLYLVTAAALPVFRPTYDALVSMGFYNLNPDEMKELQSPDAGELLHRDGANIASVIARLAADRPDLLERVRRYLQQILPDVVDVQRIALGPKETLEFRQEVKGASAPWKFYAQSMSDGTLRALGALVAVMQLAAQKVPASLVGIEEPETALHPAAAGALMDALREAAARTQVVLTTHSPDLLDRADPAQDRIFVVVSREGTTEIGPLDGASETAIRDHLYSAGELLRMDQLEPDAGSLARQRQLRLFDSDEDDA